MVFSSRENEGVVHVLTRLNRDRPCHCPRDERPSCCCSTRTRHKLLPHGRRPSNPQENCHLTRLLNSHQFPDRHAVVGEWSDGCDMIRLCFAIGFRNEVVIELLHRALLARGFIPCLTARKHGIRWEWSSIGIMGRFQGSLNDGFD